MIPTRLCDRSQDASAGRISYGKGCRLGVSGMPRGKDEQHQSIARVVAGGSHPPHAEATVLVCLWRSPARSYSIHLLVPALGSLSEVLGIGC